MTSRDPKVQERSNVQWWLRPNILKARQIL